MGTKIVYILVAIIYSAGERAGREKEMKNDISNMTSRPASVIHMIVYPPVSNSGAG